MFDAMFNRVSPRDAACEVAGISMPLMGLACCLCAFLLLRVSDTLAQGVPLRPPTPAVSSPPAASGLQSATATKAQPVVLGRFKTLKVNGQVVDLATMKDTDALKGKSGRTISVARIKQLQARIDAASSAPMIVAKPGQSLKMLATAPAGTRISLPNSRVARAQDLAKVQTIYAKLNTKRVIKAVPVSNPGARASGVVGQNGLTLADALKRPATEVIQVGSRKYTAEQLREIDTQLKASKREPRGLVQRVNIRPGVGNSANILRDGKAKVGK